MPVTRGPVADQKNRQCVSPLTPEEGSSVR